MLLCSFGIGMEVEVGGCVLWYGWISISMDRWMCPRRSYIFKRCYGMYMYVQCVL